MTCTKLTEPALKAAVVASEPIAWASDTSMRGTLGMDSIFFGYFATHRGRNKGIPSSSCTAVMVVGSGSTVSTRLTDTLYITVNRYNRK